VQAHRCPGVTGGSFTLTAQARAHAWDAAIGQAADAIRAGPECMTRRPRHHAARATDREVGVVAAVLVAGSENAAAHRLGPSHSTGKHHLANARSKVGAETTTQLVWILASRLPELLRDAHDD